MVNNGVDMVGGGWYHVFMSGRELNGEVFVCGWLMEVASGHPEPDFYADTVRVVECGAVARGGDWGWECEAGHSYVNMETRWAEGWDYFDD